MKKVVVVGLLSVFMASAGIDSVAAQSHRLETFADWCENQESLIPEARHTVAVLLEIAETQECDRAENRLVNSTELNLNNHEIEDVTPLAHLTHLTKLYLSHNQIKEITPLARLRNLTDLDLWNNQIAEITPLAPLTNLKTLDLSDNPLNDRRVCPVQPESICEF